MSEVHADTRERRVTQGGLQIIAFGRRCSTWSEREIEMLREIAPRDCNAAMLTSMFPDRTLKAIKKMLSRVRADGGHLRNTCSRTPGDNAIGVMLDPDDEGIDDDYEKNHREAAERGNALYLAAMRRACLQFAA